MRLPNGSQTLDSNEYHSAWDKVIRRFERLTDTRITSYDPTISGHYLGNPNLSFQIPLWLVTAINKLHKGTKRAKKKV